MSELAKRIIITNLLTLLYTGLALVYIGIITVKNKILFKEIALGKRKLEPPTCLADPKYGVHKYIKVNNVKLHYVESGDPSKPLMIFLHGFPEFWYSWRHQIVDFQNDYWCIAVDMRGYGDSERPEGVNSYKLEVLIEDVRDLIRQLGREKCILVAHDWGTLVASRFREVYPKVLSGVVLLAGGSAESLLRCIFEDSQQMKKSWYIFFYRMPAVPEMLLQLDDLGWFDSILLIPGKDTMTKQDVECYKYWYRKEYALTPTINYYRAMFAYQVTKKRFTEDVPMLMAYAQKDAYIKSTSFAEKMKEQYENIEITTIEDCSHFLQQEEPEKVNKYIRDFLVKHNL